ILWMAISAGGRPLEDLRSTANQRFARTRKSSIFPFSQARYRSHPDQDRAGDGNSPFMFVDFSFLTQSQFRGATGGNMRRSLIFERAPGAKMQKGG
ncbi:MAG: hypothetical protein PHP59_07680, partial [Methanofollis sp.]|uniref:hypothetical protein n=1 Tax=Methanofollis sp. TaxID=2052835 RepID=UPI002605112A